MNHVTKYVETIRSLSAELNLRQIKGGGRSAQHLTVAEIICFPIRIQP